MSHEATAAAWAYVRATPDLDRDAAFVLLALADRQNGQTGRLHPSITRLAADCHCSPRQVHYALRALRAAGVVSWVSGGGPVANTYRLLIPNPAPGAPCTACTGAQRAGPPCTVCGSPVHGVHTNQERTRNRTSAPAESCPQGPDPECDDCAGSGWRTVNEATNTVAPCPCARPLRAVR